MSEEIATLGGGCFWCLEAVYQEVEGVISVVSGYTGGHVENPTYKAVCSGTTGHVEVVQVTFQPEAISYRDILKIFFAIHDPTSRDRQGNDAGPQYRSVIYYHSDEQKSEAGELVEEINGEQIFSRPIVTELMPAVRFYRAEEYHQNYFRDNPGQPYCLFAVSPKVKKFRQVFAEKRRQPVAG